MLIEWEVVSVCLCVGCFVKTCTYNIGNVGNLSAILLIVVLQEVVTVCGLGQESLADNHVHFLGCNGDALLEAVDNLSQQTAIDIGAVDDIIQLKLGNGNRPNFATKCCKCFCHSFKVKDVDFLLGNSLAYLINHEYDANISILFKITGQIILQFNGIVVLYA